VTITPPSGPLALICESNSQIKPSVETRVLAKKLWDKGNFVPYAAKGVSGGTKIGKGYSLICNRLHFHLHFTEGRWVNSRGAKVRYLDLGHYPVVTKSS
jgi:hypothetical protein